MLRSARVGLMELQAEFFKRAEHNSLPNPPHRVKVKVEVVDRVERGRRHLVRYIQMTQIRAGKVPARITTTAGIWRVKVLSITRVLDHQRSPRRQELSVARVPRRQHAVEHVDAARHAFDEIVRHAGPHQISRTIRRQQRRGMRDDLVHHIHRFADAESADPVAFEPDVNGRLRALGSETREDAPLDDAKLGLPGVAHPDIPNAAFAECRGAAGVRVVPTGSTAAWRRE